MFEYWDVTIFRWLNSWAGVRPLWDALIIFCATYLWYIVMAAVALFVVITLVSKFRSYRRRNTELFIFTFVSAFVARFVVTELIRFSYNRPRPFDLPAEALAKAGADHITQLIPHVSGGSFPSGHASLAFAVATAVSFYYPKTSILFFLAAFSISLGRVAAGVHWPSDILAGAIAGVGTAFTIHFLFRKFRKMKRAA
ncbi:MAG: phosphatase PAP2 family protein [Candidatus Sungbacteria bacterium]|nr:phosphatase PAP2 family protein [Candidatus Sungbacteria bacterium]